ncbi:MAG: zinc ABC transporter substrate-binding protein [Kiritimatiellia bacterium]
MKWITVCCGLLIQMVHAEETFQVAATIGMVGDVVRNVAGDYAGVTVIVGSDVDPHLYRPTRGDVLKLQQSDIIFYNGMMLEGKMGDVLVRMARRGKPVYAVTEEIAERGDFVILDEEKALDPHVWMDVNGWMEAVKVIEKGLSEYKPDLADHFQKRAEAYTRKLTRLDAYAREVLSSIPENQRVLVTAHDAFSYLGRAYGLEVRGIQGLSTESEAGLRDIENLIDFLVSKRIPAVFVETSVSDKNIRALVEGCRARDHQIVIGGELYSDAMGEAGTYEGTYIGMIDHNVTTIARALGGEAPKGGMRDW